MGQSCNFCEESRKNEIKALKEKDKFLQDIDPRLKTYDNEHTKSTKKAISNLETEKLIPPISETQSKPQKTKMVAINPPLLSPIIITNEECKSLDECQYIQRVIKTLKYYHSLHSIDIIKQQTELMEFVNNQHTNLLNDYHHMIFVHEKDIQNLPNLLSKQYDISPCDINQCIMSQRHQRNPTEIKQQNGELNDIELTFWMDLLDTIHCYLLHTFDYGYRMIPISNSKEFKYTDCIDTYIGKVKEYILPKKKAMNRLNTYKYNLLFPPDDNDDEENGDENGKRPKLIKRIYSHKREPINFNIGKKYYYWDHYKTKDEYVEAKYVNIKEEILNNTIYKLDKTKYDKITIKTIKMIDTEYAKSLKANCIQNHHYGADSIENGANIDIKHLLSITLYIDCNILSEKLSKTYCSERLNEQFFSIKSRHKEFRNWSKLLRETVDYFGTMASELGSCYVGCKNIIAPSLSIRLRAPTSTSKYLEVAMRFIDDINDGMILEISHNEHGSTDVTGFPCHWMSNFVQEHEILFIGGKHKLKLCTIRKLQTNANFNGYFKALHFFDCMLSGIEIPSIESQMITNDDYKFLDDIITKQLTYSSQYDIILTPSPRNNDENREYMENMFDLYCNDKKTIIIDLFLVNRYFKTLEKLIISEKIPNLVLLNHIGLLFTNVTEIGINANGPDFRIDLISFLNEIGKPNCSNFEKIQIRCQHIQSVSWLCNTWCTDLEFQFYCKKWKAVFVPGKGTDYDDILTLTKQRQRQFTRAHTVSIGKSIILS